MGENNYLFIFTITPVQSFIAQARKTRDLYAGSQILSELTKRAIEIAHKKYKAEIIKPYIEDFSKINEIHSIPNRFVAKFNNLDEENLEKIGKNIEFNTLLFWRNSISKKVLENLKGKGLIKNNPNEEWFLKFNDHITKYFNIYWLFYPLKRYYEDYKEAEKYLGAIKNIRCFEQFDTDENHRKCSVCGERDAIVYRDKNKNQRKKLPPFAYPNALELKVNTLIEGNEGLCGICFVKRFYKYEKGKEYFPSTAKITRIDIFNNEDIKNLIDEYKKNFPNCWNDQFLIEENINKTYLKKQGCNINQINLEEIKKELKNIKSLIKDKNIKTSKYYALIKFDGDNMGKWLSGEFLEDKTQLEKFHEILSQKLRDFADWSKRYIDGHEDDKQRGKTVYAGGDDFLGFINLKYLFEVLEHLYKEFKERVNKPLHQEFKLSNNITFSAGIVIAHYKDPLSLVLDWANKLEEEAKNLPNKNAFGIAVLKRSGEIRKAIYEWDKLEYVKEIFESIVKREEFSSSFITKLEESFRKILIDFYLYEEDKFENLSKKLMSNEISSGYRLENYSFSSKDNFIYPELFRVLKRSKKNENLKDNDIKNFINKNFKELVTFKRQTYNLASFFGILDILRFIEREL